MTPASSNFQALHPSTNISPSVAILKEKFEEARQHDEEDLKKKATASAMDTPTDVTPKSKKKILQESMRLQKERPAQVLVSPAGIQECHPVVNQELWDREL